MATDGRTRPDAPRLARQLASIPLFASLPADQLVALVERGQVQSLPPDCTVVQEGDPADALYVLLAGSARVYKRHADGAETQLAEQLLRRAGATGRPAALSLGRDDLARRAVRAAAR